MDAELATFIVRHGQAIDEEAATWYGGTMPLSIRSYLSAEVPPSAVITSVRAIAFQADAVLVLRNRDSTHIMPGGRRERGESLEETLRREVREEAGWTLAHLRVLGFRQFHYLAPKPPAYTYPYPDFIWLIYTADAVDYQPIARTPDEYELEASFQSLATVERLQLTRAERLFLEAAAQRRAPDP